MKKQLPILFMVMMAGLLPACNNKKKSGEAEVTDGAAPAGPPYTVQVQEFVNPKLPALHSYTHAVYKDKIVMIGGRTNGLHGSSYKFDQTNSNKNIYVVDTKNWSDPAGWAVFSMPDTKITFTNKQQFRANNAQFFTQDSVLYIVGGLLGANVPTRLKVPGNPQGGMEMVASATTSDGNAASGPVTLPYLTAVTLPALINTVMNRQPLPANAIRQVQDSSLALTGGELDVIAGTVYLTFGWDFSFTGGDLYSHQIRTFTYKDDGTTLSISPITVCPTCWDGKVGADTLGNFRRRDGSLSSMIDPKTGAPAMLYYAGVFKDGDTNFDTPVWITPGAAAEQPFVMRSNVYTCQVVPVYSKRLQMSYATLLGGMKNALYNGGPIKAPVELTEKNAPIIQTDSKNPFDHIPFSNQFSTIAMTAGHNLKQYLLPDSFPNTIVPLRLPASAADTMPASVLPAGSVTYNGSESEIIWKEAAWVLPNGVIDYDAFIKANPAGGSIGYLHGGIQSALTNVFGVKSAHFSVASNRIFTVKILPLTK